MKNKAKTIFREFCSAKGMRYTRERELIIEEIYRKDEHFDVDSLFMRIRTKNPETKLAKGSIYRTLPHLVCAGLITKSLAEDGFACYEHTLGHTHHDHMKCVSCGVILEFQEKRIEKIEKDVCAKHEFEMITHMHVINGYCAKCRKKKNK